MAESFKTIIVSDEEQRQADDHNCGFVSLSIIPPTSEEDNSGE